MAEEGSHGHAEEGRGAKLLGCRIAEEQGQELEEAVAMQLRTV
jgi:hypothetical protein